MLSSEAPLNYQNGKTSLLLSIHVFFKIFIYVFLAVLGLHSAQALSSCREWGLLFTVVLREQWLLWLGSTGFRACRLQ